MPSRDRLLLAQMLVSPSSVTFEQPRSAASAPFTIGFAVAAIIAVVAMTAFTTTPSKTTQTQTHTHAQAASVQH